MTGLCDDVIPFSVVVVVRKLLDDVIAFSIAVLAGLFEGNISISFVVVVTELKVVVVCFVVSKQLSFR